MPHGAEGKRLTPSVVVRGTPSSVLNRGPRVLMGEITAMAARRQGCSLRLGTVTAVDGATVDVTVMGSPMVRIAALNPGGAVVDDVVHVLVDRDGLAVALNPGGGTVGTVDWADITGKPSTFPPEVQALDWLSDVAVSGASDGQVLEYQAGVWVPVTPPVEGFGGGVWTQALTNRSTTAADGALTQWGETLVIPNPGEAVDLAALLTGYAAIGTAVGVTDFDVRVDYSTDGGSTWTTGLTTSLTVSSATGTDIDRGILAGSVAFTNVTPTGAIHVRAMSRRYTSTSGTGNFTNGRLIGIIPGGSGGGSGGGSVAWVDITGKPSTFTPSSHGDAAHSVNYLQKTGGTMSGDINMGGSNTITNMGAPGGAQQAMRREDTYGLDSLANGPRIWISISGPSGGNDDDVWIQRET